MGNYKLLALDMDGTVLNEQKEVSPGNKEAIAEAVAAGVTVMFATGRGIPNVLSYVEELELPSPLVTVNGSEVWRAPGQLFRRHLLSAGHVLRMKEIALDVDSWYWAYTTDGVLNKENWLTEEQDPEAMQWLKFGYYTEDVKVLTRVREELESWGVFEVTNSHPFNIELNPKGVSKASGLLDVCGLLGIEMSDVVAAGDSLNDAAMIRAAGLGVAMGNAQDEVKLLADTVVGTNEEDGVAEIIRKFILN